MGTSAAGVIAARAACGKERQINGSKENIRVEVRDRGARQEEGKGGLRHEDKDGARLPLYGERQVLKDITFDMGENKVTAFIGPSGCGKSSYLRCLNRMNDFISSARVEGTINIDGENILAPSTDVIGLRRKVGWSSRSRTPSRCRYTTT